MGSEGKIKFSLPDLKKILRDGAKAIIQRGFGWNGDELMIEEQGAMVGADPTTVSEKALERGKGQLGTLGSGNHFLEIETVKQIFDPHIAKVFGLYPDQILIMIHTGSRGFGHQVCTDHLRVMQSAMRKYNIYLPDRQLACAPFQSIEGQQYFSAMACAANFAWANRQLITHWVRESFEKVFFIVLLKIWEWKYFMMLLIILQKLNNIGLMGRPSSSVFTEKGRLVHLDQD